jgi:DNA-binding CsgD family transcriptional regulator
VSITLSSSDIAQLQAAMTTLVSPLRFDQLSDWRSACRVEVETLINAHSSAGMLFYPGEPVANSHDHLAAAMGDYLSYYHTLDTGLQQRRRALGLNVAHWSAVYDMHELVKTEIYNDFSKRRGLLDGIAMTYDMDNPASLAALLFYHERPDSKPFGERGLALLQLLFPAFKAGIDTCFRLVAQKDELGSVFDELAGALSLFDRAGRLVQVNSAMADLLRKESDREKLSQQISRVADAFAEHLRKVRRRRKEEVAFPMWSEIRTPGRRYKIAGSLLSPGVLAPQAMIVVVVNAVGGTQLTDAELRVKYRLTGREVEVARLLGERRGTAQIARALLMSPHTARHHTERVLQKLGVHSRQDVEGALRA